MLVLLAHTLVLEKVSNSFPLSDRNANAHSAVKAFSFPVFLKAERLVPVYPKEKHSAYNKLEVAPVKGKEPGYIYSPRKGGEHIMIKILNVGIDISLNKACCCFLPQEGEYISRVFEVENNPSGFDKLKARLLETTKNRSFALIRVGLEASSMYGYHLTEYFKNISLPAEIKIYVINAKYIHRFKKAFPENTKLTKTLCSS